MDPNSIDHLSPAQHRLWVAVRRSNVEEARRCLEDVALDADLADAGGTPLLHLCCSGVVKQESDAVTMCQMLLDAGAPVNARAGNGETPLVVAAAFGRAKVLELLLQHGGNPLLTDDEGKTPLDVAGPAVGHPMVAVMLSGTDANHKECVRLLEQACNAAPPLMRQPKEVEGCGHCGRQEGELQRCAGCRLRWYCNVSCQRAAWRTHKSRCRAAADLRGKLEKAADPSQPTLARAEVIAVLAERSNKDLRTLAVQLKGVKMMLAALRTDRPVKILLPHDRTEEHIVSAVALRHLMWQGEVESGMRDPSGAPITADVLQRDAMDQFGAAHGHEVVLRRALQADCPADDTKELLRLLADMHIHTNDKYGVEMVLSRRAGPAVVRLLTRIVMKHPTDTHVVSNAATVLGSLCLGQHERRSRRDGSSGGGGASTGSGSGTSGVGRMTALVLQQRDMLHALARHVFDLSVPGGCVRQAPAEFFVCLAHNRAAFDQLTSDARLEGCLLSSMLPPLTFAGTAIQAAALEWFHLATTYRRGYLTDRGFDALLQLSFQWLGDEIVNIVFNAIGDGLLQAVQAGLPGSTKHASSSTLTFRVEQQPLKAARLLRCMVCQLKWPGMREWVRCDRDELRSAAQQLGGEAAHCLQEVLQHCGVA